MLGSTQHCERISANGTYHYPSPHHVRLQRHCHLKHLLDAHFGPLRWLFVRFGKLVVVHVELEKPILRTPGAGTTLI